jgi:predicted trehalose synthase
MPIFKDAKTDEELTREAEPWVNRAHNLIVAAYGDGEAALFMYNS